jgi:hypothetical protein
MNYSFFILPKTIIPFFGRILYVLNNKQIQK